MEGIVASRNYNPGDVIYNEPAFAKVFKREFKDAACEFCSGRYLDLRACSNCLAVKYCGKKCQKSDWNSHKLECKHLQNLPGGPSTDFVRLLGKIILKIQGQDWKLVTSKVLEKEFSFDDIDSHYKEMTENPRMVLFFNEMKELTGKFIGFENLPDDDNLIKIVGKVRFNLFQNTRIIGFFIGASNLNRECIPNSNVFLCGNSIKIWACKKISKGEDKISVPGRMIFLPSLRFSGSDANSCKCVDCSLPFGESILFKVVDKKKAFNVICETERLLDSIEAYNYMLGLPEVHHLSNHLLHEQENVLGDTNYLHLKLLAFKSLNMSGELIEKHRLLLKLETSMRSVFGEYYIEMLPIYKDLCALNVHFGSPEAAVGYAEKAMRIERHLLQLRW